MNQWSSEQIADLRRRLLCGENLPVVDNVEVTMEMVLFEARRLAAEQEHVVGNKLSEEYLKDLKKEKEVTCPTRRPPHACVNNALRPLSSVHATPKVFRGLT